MNANLIGRGFLKSQYFYESEFKGRYPRSLADLIRTNGGISYPSAIDVDETTTIDLVSIYGKTRKGQNIQFSNVEFLKVKANEYTFIATIDSGGLIPRLLARYVRRDDVYVSGRFKVDIRSTDIYFYDFQDIIFHGVGKKAMDFIRGVKLLGYGIHGRRSNIEKKDNRHANSTVHN